jgi:hypothetical protein
MGALVAFGLDWIRAGVRRESGARSRGRAIPSQSNPSDWGCRGVPFSLSLSLSFLHTTSAHTNYPHPSLSVDKTARRQYSLFHSSS